MGLVLLWAAGWLGWLGRAGSSSSLILNHLQALELEARGEVDVGGRVTVFAQAFRSLHFMVRTWDACAWAAVTGNAGTFAVLTPLPLRCSRLCPECHHNTYLYMLSRPPSRCAWRALATNS